METTNALTSDLIAGFSQDFRADDRNAIRQHAVMAFGLEAAAASRDPAVANPMAFSLDLGSVPVTNQKSSGRCWLFAALNAIRRAALPKLNLEEFEISQNYMMFWDKLEKANKLLETIIATASEPLDGRLLSHFMSSPVWDGGQWYMYVALTEKYGCVPKDVMPETFHSSDTKTMNSVLGRKMRQYTVELRKAIAAGADDIQSVKNRMLGEVYNYLAICLGEPPSSFDFEYRDKDKEFHRDAGITPKDFYDKYVGVALRDYVSVINAPMEERPFGRTYTFAYSGNVVGAEGPLHLNLPVSELKRLAIEQLQDGRPVWFVCDIAFMASRDTGVLAPGVFDMEGVTGMRFDTDKGDRFRLRMLLATHAMVFVGVNLVDGKPTRWKVENSWGEEKGKKGYFVMTDDWFDKYVYQIVVDRRFLTPEEAEAFKREPVVLDRWDPFASLAED
jgi:bleomycin hydrolase